LPLRFMPELAFRVLPVDAMRKLATPILYLATLTSLVLAQDADVQKRFAGAWVAKVHDKVVCTIKLEAAQTISGAMHACQIHVDGDGELIEPEAAETDDKPEPLLDPKIQAGTLAFGIKDEDGEPPLKLELKLTGEGQAELRFVGAPVAIKPIHFAKQ
jgi:hypothetical protein